MFQNTANNYEKMSKLEKSFDETNDTLPDSVGRPYTMDGYSSESISMTQPQCKEYYTYPNSVVHGYENKSNSSVNVGCTGNAFSCKPQNTKVFIRRVDNKRKMSNKKPNSLNSSFCHDFNPYVIYPSNSVHGGSIEEYNYAMPVNDNSSPLNEKYICDKSNRFTYAYLSDDLNYSLNGQLLNIDNTYTNVPLCVRESFYDSGTCNLVNQMYPLAQGTFNANNVLPNILDVRCDISARDILRYIQNVIRYIFKVVKLAFAKIKRDLNTKEIYFDSTMPSVQEMDMDCDVCRQKYGDILMDAHRKDCISFFEGVDESRTIFTKIWDIINNWLDSKENNKMEVLTDKNKVEEMIREKSKEFEQVYYQMDKFPKDEKGRIQLPQFGSFERHSAILI
ncbi:inner membrane complex protein, putative [Plasmodium ovale wallikeri]|uniref:Inner membrane complex protein, putative n=1 Tax=Plasmodium ovale wallikeri TaxID=864142 RepID=A0A1A8Z8C6_PLAOA|nr:inner membrane complex protein, putative [Plasmodium ovale wallikeri]SBT40561.1 inner membrane complex protein, putative [Plasmodium ovale wallikeri]